MRSGDRRHFLPRSASVVVGEQPPERTNRRTYQSLEHDKKDGSGKYALQPNRDNAHRDGDDDPKTSAEEQTLLPATDWAQVVPVVAREAIFRLPRQAAHL